MAPRIVLDVSCVTGINHESHFSWQAQYWWCWLVTPAVATRSVATIKHECRRSSVFCVP